jgi:hypothetical protein
MLELPDVTLIFYEVKAHDMLPLALRQIIEKVQFAEIHVYSDINPSLRCVQWFPADPSGDMTECTRMVWHEIHKSVKTSHFLIAQWDSGIIDPGLWSDDFLSFDYIGAPWPWRHGKENVGCGGFSLRSVALNQYLTEHQEEFPLVLVEDDVLCRQYRPRLEAAGFKWAPKEIAKKFAFERGTLGPEKSFGFHGAYNLPLFLPREDLVNRISQANTYVAQKSDWAEMLNVIGYLSQRK